MTNTTNNLPPKLQPSASLLALSPVRPKYRDARPPEVQEAFQFLLATAVHEGGKPRFGKFDLLVHIAFNAPLRSRRERADTVRREHKNLTSHRV